MAATETGDFFRQERGASEIKTEILHQYFVLWCNIMLSGQKEKSGKTALYIDLSAGREYDENKNISSLFKILDIIFRSTGASPDLNKAVQVFYYNATITTQTELEESIKSLPYYEELVYKPEPLHEEAKYELLKGRFTAGASALIFLDPFKDIFSQEILLNAVKEWSADIVMLFTAESINAAIKSRKTSPQLQEVFGDKLTDVKAYYKTVRDASKREAFALAIVKDVFVARGYTLFEFKINAFAKDRANQYLLLAVKTDAAYIAIKELMLAYTEFQEDGVPLFGANLKQQQIGLFREHYTYSIVNLVHDLVQKTALYNNKTLQSIYEKDNIGTNYCRDNYISAYQMLKQQGKVIFVNPKTGQTISALTYTSIIRYKK